MLWHLSPHLSSPTPRPSTGLGIPSTEKRWWGARTTPEPMWQKLPNLVFHRILDLEENLKLLSHSTFVETNKQNLKLWFTCEGWMLISSQWFLLLSLNNINRLKSKQVKMVGGYIYSLLSRCLQEDKAHERVVQYCVLCALSHVVGAVLLLQIKKLRFRCFYDPHQVPTLA